MPLIRTSLYILPNLTLKNLSAMQGLNATKWAKTIEKKLDQLCKNKVWELVHKNNVKPGHWTFGDKWV